MIKNIKGIVIKEIGYRTSDKIVTILTEDDHFRSFKAKGALKVSSPLSKNTTLGSISSFELEEKIENGHQLLINAQIESYPSSILKSLEKMAVLTLILEAINYLENNEGIYKLLESSLMNLNNEEQPLELLLFFIYQMIKYEGIALNLDECVICNAKSRIVAVDYEQGGFVCFKHGTSSKSNDYLKLIRLVSKIKIENLDSLNSFDYGLKYQLLSDLLNYFKERSGYNLKSATFTMHSLAK